MTVDHRLKTLEFAAMLNPCDVTQLVRGAEAIRRYIEYPDGYARYREFMFGLARTGQADTSEDKS